MLIEQIQWRNGDGLEDLATAVQSIKTVAEKINDMATEPEPNISDILSLNIVEINMLESVHNCLYRFVNERQIARIIDLNG